MLTDTKLRTLRYKTKQTASGQLVGNRYPDRDGMYVHVSPSNTVSFRYDFRWPRSATGKRQCLTHGRYPLMSLEAARDAHIEALRKLRTGTNPLDERRQEKKQGDRPDDFKSVAERWYEKSKAGKSSSWLKANRRYLDAAYPYIGGKKIKEITARDISNVISPVEEKGKGVTAEKMRLTYVMVFDYAADKPEFLIPHGSNPAKALSVDVPDTKHHPHLAIPEVAPFLKHLDESTNIEQVKLAVRLLMLTLVRKMELCGAKWTEVDLDGARWEIPAERMKGKRPHVVPLSEQAVTIFRRLKELAGESVYVFPRPDKSDRHILDGTLNEVFRASGFKATPHGCRSTGSSALNELGYRPDAIERQLSHVEADEVRASYNHADYMMERRKMLQTWADAIDRLCAGRPLIETGANVVPLHAAA